MKKPTADEVRRVLEESAAARQRMQEILDRVEAHRLERVARRERGVLRRLLAR